MGEILHWTWEGHVCACMCICVCAQVCALHACACVCVFTSVCTACGCLCVYVCAQVCALHACACVCTSVCTTCVCLCVCVHKCVCTVHYWGRKYGVSLQALSHVLLPLKSFHNSFNRLPEKRVSEKKLLLKTPLLKKMPWLSPVI